MSLFRAERRRLFKRRFTRWMLVVGVLLLGAVAASAFASNHKTTPEVRAAAQREADEQYAQNVRFSEQYKRECETAKSSGTSGAERFPDDCEVIQPPPREYFTADNYMPPTFTFRTSFPETITVFTMLVALVGFLIGASYVGAEWTSGGMMNLLIWRPRRLQVLFTKLGTLLAGMFSVSVVLGAAWTAGFWAIAVYRGSTERMTPGVWRSLALTGTRGIGLILVMTALGFALASIGRHTAIALGIAGGVALVGQLGLGFALASAGVAFWERWLLPTYLEAWMEKSVRLQDYRVCVASPGGGCEPSTLLVTWQHAGLVFAGMLVLVIGVATWLMRRRDVT